MSLISSHEYLQVTDNTTHRSCMGRLCVLHHGSGTHRPEFENYQLQVIFHPYKFPPPPASLLMWSLQNKYHTLSSSELLPLSISPCHGVAHNL